jgi:3-dehydroquinate synthase
MRCALALGARLGLPDADAIALRINGLLDRLRLPSTLPAGVDRAALEAALTRDKKRDGDGVRFVLCTRPGAFESRRVPWASALASISALKSQSM